MKETNLAPLAGKLPAGDCLVVFTAKWCAACDLTLSALKPPIHPEIARPLNIVTLDVDDPENHAVIQPLDVKQVPTTLLVRDGVCLGRLTGGMSERHFWQQVMAHFKRVTAA